MAEQKSATTKSEPKKKKAKTFDAPVKKKPRLDVQEAIKEKRVFEGEVAEIHMEEDGTQSLLVELKGSIFPSHSLCKVPRAEADNNFASGSLMYLVNRKVPVVILKEHRSGEYTGSRKIAQEIRFSELKANFENPDNIFEGTILNFTRTGTFVDVYGVVGFLKNSKFSVDHSTPLEHGFNIGSKIEITCAEITEKNQIFWGRKNKVHRAHPVKCDFRIGDIVRGEVASIQEFNDSYYAFVAVRPGIDVMAFIPSDMAVCTGQIVTVKVVGIEEGRNSYEEQKVRGRLINNGWR